MDKVINKNDTMMCLEKRIMEEYQKITIEDDSEAILFEIRKEKDMYIDNVIICLRDIAMINRYKVERLEANLDLLALRLYNTEEDFTDDEKFEITEALEILDLEDLKNIKNNKDFFKI